MKRVYSLVLCFVLILLAAGAGSARAQENSLAGSQGARAPSAAAAETFAHFYIVRADTKPTPWEQTSTVVDRSGGIHTTFYTDESIHYAYCPRDCGSVSSWSETDLAPAGSYDSLDHPTLVVDASSRPRIMWYIEPNYVYAECNANCTVKMSWKTVVVPVVSKYYIYPKSSRYFTLDTHGRPRFVVYGSAYLNEHNYWGFAYTTCDSGCTSAANWHSYFIDLGEDMTVDMPQIVFNASDQPRVMGINRDANYVYKLVYLGCNANCSQTANWTYIKLYEVGQDANFAFRLDSQGRARVAFYREDANDKNLYYAWSLSPVINPNGWLVKPMPYPPNDYRTVDLAVDSLDRPRIAFASDKQDLEYLVCTANCADKATSTWQLQHIETSDALDAADPIPLGGCIVSTWMMDGYPSLALDGMDRTTVSYYARHYKFCLGSDGQYHTLHDFWTLRLSTAGSGPSLDQRMYLPAVVR